MAKDKKKGKGKKDDAEELPPGLVVTPVFRAGYMGLPDKDSGQYTVTAIWPKKTKFKDMEALADKTLKSKVDEDAEFSDGYKDPWNDGDKRAKKAKRDGKPRPEYEGSTYCYFSNRDPVPITDENGESIEDEDGLPDYRDKRLHSGAYFRAIVNAYYYDNQSEGVQFGLYALQFVEEGERLGGGGVLSGAQAEGLFKRSSMDGAPPSTDKGKKSDKGSKKDKGKKGKK